MKLLRPSHLGFLFISGLSLALACGDDDASSGASGGGGGKANATGGSKSGTGGATTGGSKSGTGGKSSGTGGNKSTGGESTATGGVETGGTPSTGGASTTGGTSTGGRNTGGTSTSETGGSANGGENTAGDSNGGTGGSPTNAGAGAGGETSTGGTGEGGGTSSGGGGAIGGDSNVGGSGGDGEVGGSGGGGGGETTCIELEDVQPWIFLPADEVEDLPPAYATEGTPNLGAAAPDYVLLNLHTEQRGHIEFGTGNEASWQTCEHCLIYFTDVSSTTSGISFIATAGALDIEESSKPFDGYFDAVGTNITLTESNSNDEIIPNGRCVHFNSMRILVGEP
jgi:hypothetical protein